MPVAAPFNRRPLPENRFVPLPSDAFAPQALLRALKDADTPGSDRLFAAILLYNHTSDAKFLTLARQIIGREADWTSFLHTLTRASLRGASEAAVADGFALASMRALVEGGLKNETAFSVGYEKLMKLGGAVHGLFCAEGANPSNPVSTQALIALLRALERVLWTQGDAFAADLYEYLVENALPASVGFAFQAANQIALPTPGEAGFTPRAAMETASSGLALMLYAPGEIVWRKDAVPVRVRIDTAYPHGEGVRIHVRAKTPVRFPLTLRVPAWAAGATLDGEPVETGFIEIERLWSDDALTLILPMSPRAVSRAHQTVSIERGAILYAFPVGDDDAWKIALLPERGLAVEGRNIRAWGAPIPWNMREDRPASPPVAPRVEANSARPVTLVPYADAPLRIAQFPLGVEIRKEP